VISKRWAGKKMKCTCGAYIQIEELQPRSTNTNKAIFGKTRAGKSTKESITASVLDELTPLDWSPKQNEREEKSAFEAREEKVLMSFILKDRERRNPAVAFGLMVLLAIVNFSFAVIYWVLAWLIQDKPEIAERVTESYPVVDAANIVTVFLVSGIVSMLTAVFVMIPFSAFWWIVAFILSTSTSIRVFEIGRFFFREDAQGTLPKPVMVTFAIVVFMTGYFFSQDARDYFRMRLNVGLAMLICGSFALFVLLLLVFQVLRAESPTT
jgi:hypothetical protein